MLSSYGDFYDCDQGQFFSFSFFLIFSVCCFIGLMALHVLIVLWIFNVSGVTVSVLYFVMLCLDELIDRICVSVLDARA